MLMLRLQQKKINAETLKAKEAITTLLSMLSDYYYQDKAGTLEFE